VSGRIRRVLDGEVMPPVEERFLKFDGTVVPVEVAAACYPDRNGRGVQVIVRDVRERKRMEDQLRAQNERLSEADRHKDEFLAMLAHELRNPLAPLLIAAQLLEQRGAEDPALVQWASGVIKHQGEQLAHLVNELLDVARVTQGKITLQKTPLDLRDVISHAVEANQPLIDEHRHALRLSLPSEPISIEGDSVRLEQVIENLLNNAAKYTPDGGQIDLSLVRDGEAAVIRVRDNGFGISAAMLPKVFGLFVQAERTPDRAQGGLGIGLALVKSLVAMHGGRVEAHSEGLGRGSEFLVRLPLPMQRPAVSDGVRRAVPRSATTTSRRVLVVDDNGDMATSMAMLLKSMGHEAQVASSGREALDAIKTAPPDVVLLDIGMPDLDGYEVARRLRRGPGLDGVKLIAMTGYGQACDRKESERAGFDHHLIKPVDPQELEQILAS
jgi:signal transduction histidine kinase/CheY-like chemotaxis protein